MMMVGRSWSGGSEYRYGFNDMEEINEFNNSNSIYNSEYRQYDGRLGKWMSIDPLVQKFPWQSPYVGMDNNPIFLMDPNGDSTFVNKNSNGTYSVIGGNLDGDHNGIFIQKADGSIGEMIGYSVTPESFYCSDCDVLEKDKWMGTINTTDQSGRNFLNNYQKNYPGLLKYIGNAEGGEKYDFKRTNGGDESIYNVESDYYRGMPLMSTVNNQRVFASARDVGNIGAGLTAGLSGMSWGIARFGFDLLETKQHYNETGNINWTTETTSTQYSQKVGFEIGAIMYYNNQVHSNPTIYGWGSSNQQYLKKIPTAVLAKKNLIKKFY